MLKPERHVMDGVRRIALVETKTVDASIPAFAPTTMTRLQLGNHLGSTALEVSESGAVISYEEYHPYGTTAYQSASSAVEVSRKRYRYTGKERDDETGLCYHGARYYAPWLGRWTSADPGGIVDGADLYAYARSNPLTFVDPSGKESVLLGSQKDVAGPDAKLNEAENGNFKRRADMLKAAMVARGSKAENIHTASVDTGAALLGELKSASARGPIKNLVVYGHSWVDNLIMKWNQGFFHSWNGPGGARNLNDLKGLMDRGEVRFDADAIAIFASCGCAGATTLESDKFAAKFTMVTGVTTIAAIGMTEPKQEGKSDAKQTSPGFHWVKIERVADAAGGFRLVTTALPGTINPIDYVKKDNAAPQQSPAAPQPSPAAPQPLPPGASASLAPATPGDHATPPAHQRSQGENPSEGYRWKRPRWLPVTIIDILR